MGKKRWEVTWLTTEGPVVKIIESDEMTFSPAGGAILGNTNNVVDINKPKDQIDITVVAHLQGYASLVETTSLIESKFEALPVVEKA